jgi:hypothetical protein
MNNISGWWCNNHLETYESQWEGLSHILWKISQMFETTNQKTMFHEVNHLLMAGWWFQPL